MYIQKRIIHIDARARNVFICCYLFLVCLFLFFSKCLRSDLEELEIFRQRNRPPSTHITNTICKQISKNVQSISVVQNITLYFLSKFRSIFVSKHLLSYRKTSSN